MLEYGDVHFYLVDRRVRKPARSVIFCCVVLILLTVKMATSCNDWEHLFLCQNSSYNVTSFSFEPTDNWFQTKQEFDRSANALFLSDEQRVFCFQTCLFGLAKSIYIAELRNLQEVTFSNLIIALDARFNLYSPLKTVNLLKLAMGIDESFGHFSLRVELAARDLFYLSTEVQDQLIFDTLLSGIPENMKDFVLDQALEQSNSVLSYTQLIQICKSFELIQLYMSKNVSTSKPMSTNSCQSCKQVVLVFLNTFGDAIENCEKPKMVQSELKVAPTIKQIVTTENSQRAEPHFVDKSCVVAMEYVSPDTLFEAKVFNFEGPAIANLSTQEVHFEQCYVVPSFETIVPVHKLRQDFCSFGSSVQGLNETSHKGHLKANEAVVLQMKDFTKIGDQKNSLVETQNLLSQTHNVTTAMLFDNDEGYFSDN